MQAALLKELGKYVDDAQELQAAAGWCLSVSEWSVALAPAALTANSPATGKQISPPATLTELCLSKLTSLARSALQQVGV